MMEDFATLYNTGWSEWRQFPNPEKKEYLYAPFGPGVYQLRNRKTKQFVLFGESGHVAYRMTSLLPKPLGRGSRDNSNKRENVLNNINDIEYRTIALDSKEMAKSFETFVKKQECYIYNT